MLLLLLLQYAVPLALPPCQKAFAFAAVAATVANSTAVLLLRV
jgi:hypothetical protein